MRGNSKAAGYLLGMVLVLATARAAEPGDVDGFLHRAGQEAGAAEVTAERADWV